MNLKHLNIGKKIYLVTGLLILIFTLTSIWLYTGYRDQLIAGRQQQIVTAVDTAWGIIDHYSKEVGEELSDSEAQMYAQSAVKTLRYEGDIYFWINDTFPRMVMHPIKPQLNGKDLSGSKDPNGVYLFKEMVSATEKSSSGFVEYAWPKPGSEEPQPKLSYVRKHPTWNWIIGSGMYIDDLNAELSTVFWTVLTVLLSVILISTVLVYLLARSISRPMFQTVDMIEEMELGHLGSRLNMDRRDEVGRMARAMDSFADSLQHDIIEALKKLAGGDLTFNIQPRDERDEIRGALKKLETDLNGIMNQIQVTGEHIAAGSLQVSDSSQSLSQGATESAASLEEISSSLTQLASQTKMNSDHASQVNQLSTGAKTAAEGGNKQMQRMVSAMDDINEAGQNISKIIKVIDEIAFQTNLLALNAAVEAARAGQHGKGFAVVAEEVRNLAARSAKAAQETAQLIEGSVDKTNNGAAIAKQTAESLETILSGVTKVSDLAEEIAASSEEQAEGISQVSEGISQIDQVTQTNTANAEECAASAQQLASQSTELEGMLKRFTLKVQPSRNFPPSSSQGTMPVQAPRQSASGWGQLHPARTPTPAQQAIALDDTEFGKY